jgi:hypothetical protein
VKKRHLGRLRFERPEIPTEDEEGLDSRDEGSESAIGIGVPP